jgi:hypothetical protein
MFFQSLKFKDSLKLTNGVFVNKIHLSEYFASKKGYFKCLKLNEALLLAESTDVLEMF